MRTWRWVVTISLTPDSMTMEPAKLPRPRLVHVSTRGKLLLTRALDDNHLPIYVISTQLARQGHNHPTKASFGHIAAIKQMGYAKRCILRTQSTRTLFPYTQI